MTSKQELIKNSWRGFKRKTQTYHNKELERLEGKKEDPATLPLGEEMSHLVGGRERKGLKLCIKGLRKKIKYQNWLGTGVSGREEREDFV